MAGTDARFASRKPMKLSKAEFETAIQASQRTHVPFHQLVLSMDYQARTSDAAPEFSIPELATSIKDCSALQNLIAARGGRAIYRLVRTLIHPRQRSSLLARRQASR